MPAPCAPPAPFPAGLVASISDRYDSFSSCHPGLLKHTYEH
jgi:hypothetical protein